MKGRRAGLILMVLIGPLAARAALPARSPIALVPLDDRPVTQQLPQMLGRIAGRSVIEPPRALLGNYLTFGEPDPIVAWLNGAPRRRAGAFIISTDMLAYGGLVASRVPGATYADAYFRLHELEHLRRVRPHAWIAGFGTIMRLAPTGVPAIGPARGFFAAYPAWKYLQAYANLHDPLLPAERARARHLARLIGPPTLDAYLATRARNRRVDRLILHLTAQGTLNRVVLGQDDAGLVGMHIPDILQLQATMVQLGLGSRASIEPGTDELGMALVAHALARGIGWRPRIAVRYSTPDGASFQDPLEFAPIGPTIASLINVCGGREVRQRADITLFVRLPHAGKARDSRLIARLRRTIERGEPVAFVDLSFIGGGYGAQGHFARRLLDDGLMSRLDAYASWNTDANSVGTALAEAIAAGVGRRDGRYNRLAHQEFTFDRILDDVAFHVDVRPDLNRTLDLEGIADHTYLLPQVAAPIARLNRALLWNRAAAILPKLYPALHIAAMRITLPWDRTFETRIDVALAPNLPPPAR